MATRSTNRVFSVLKSLSTLCLLGTLSSLMLPAVAQADSRESTGHLNRRLSDGTVSVTVLSANGNPGYSLHVPYLEADNNARGDRKNIVFVHGMAHDGDVWWPLADRLLNEHPDQIHRIYMLDLPGHGFSQWPARMTLGNLSLKDYSEALKQVLSTLQNQDGTSLGDTLLAGHSMGAMTIQVLQKQLVSDGGSLRSSLGIDRVMLMASTMPAGLPWDVVTDAEVVATLTTALEFHADNGWMVEEEDWRAWAELFFESASTGEIYPTGQPTEGDVRYMNNSEPCAATFELMGFDENVSRPEIPAGVFPTSQCADTGRACYELVSVGFDDDLFIHIGETERLHRYLTGQSSLECVMPGETTGACNIVAGPHNGIWTVPASGGSSLDGAFARALGF